VSAFRNYDAWATREPPEPQEPPECSECGEYVLPEPFKRIEHRTYERCDGEPKVIETTHDEGVLAIIGEDRRDDVVVIAYTPVCGHKDGSDVARPEEEIPPLFAEDWKHEPHWYTPEHGQVTTSYYKCPNGHVYEETDL
jgi:hypothetical protein